MLSLGVTPMPSQMTVLRGARGGNAVDHVVELLRSLVALREALLQAVIEMDDAGSRRLAIDYLEACSRRIDELARNLSNVQVDHGVTEFAKSVAERSASINVLGRERRWASVLRESRDLLIAHYSALPGIPGSDPGKLPTPPVDVEHE
jgi:hypothetical protein